jgi:predicted exporter
VLTPTGAYRAALDNETIIRHDVQLALGLSTAGIALLLFLAFPRPLFSLLSLVPPIAGTAAALFVYSLFHSSISIMVLGFAGALISIMDDFSITFLLFLDRPKATKGQEAADEVQSVGGGVCLLTTIASFLVLGLSDFPVFAALGEFTALGLIFTYLFIHFLSPRILPQMPPARRSDPPLHRISGLLFSFGKPGFVAAILFISVMLVFAKPHFRMNLADMNTVSAKTQEEDQRFTEIWGNMGQKVYLMATASSPALLQEANDVLAEQFAADKTTNRIDNAFVPSMIYPGRQLAAQNLEAWHQFWNTKRTTSLQAALTAAGMEAGFTADAFTAFYQLLAPGFTIEPLSLPEQYYPLLGITHNPDGRLVQFVSISPGSKYHADGFQDAYGKKFKIFDSAHFSDRLGDILLTTFMQSLGIMSVIISLMLFLYFLNWQLTLITLLPLVFAYVATLGTLHLIGNPLDIPGLMLTVVILGLGIDYTIYTVCGYQRYGSSSHGNFVLLRSAVLLSATSTLIGFGVLCFADHSTLRSVGITSLCGIGYSLLGTLLLLPHLLDWYYNRENLKTIPTANLEGKILQRYRLLPTYPRLFARIKLHSDPLFGELAVHFSNCTNVKNILDIGCGYGLPASWCIENFPDSSICGLDPDGEKVFIAQRAVRDRGTMITGAAPQLPGIPTGLEIGRASCRERVS